jgi:hypothetical protein
MNKRRRKKLQKKLDAISEIMLHNTMYIKGRKHGNNPFYPKKPSKIRKPNFGRVEYQEAKPILMAHAMCSVVTINRVYPNQLIHDLVAIAPLPTKAFPYYDYLKNNHENNNSGI